MGVLMNQSGTSQPPAPNITQQNPIPKIQPTNNRGQYNWNTRSYNNPINTQSQTNSVSQNNMATNPSIQQYRQQQYDNYAKQMAQYQQQRQPQQYSPTAPPTPQAVAIAKQIASTPTVAPAQQPVPVQQQVNGWAIGQGGNVYNPTIGMGGGMGGPLANYKP